MRYSLYTSLYENTLKPMRMSICLANHTYQYLIGVANNMLVQVGKFVFPVDFIIVQMEEDEKVPLILGRPFFHTADAIIRPFLNTLDKINETSLDKEFEEFMAVDVEEIPKQEEEVKDKFKELPLEGNLRIKTSIQDPPTDIEMKPLPKHLEYPFMEKDSLFPVVISALLKYDEKKHLVSVLKNHKEAFA
ncbi:reverse transcriptase domain-containing protein [Tanacetum coccineum]